MCLQKLHYSQSSEHFQDTDNITANMTKTDILHWAHVELVELRADHYSLNQAVQRCSISHL